MAASRRPCKHGPSAKHRRQQLLDRPHISHPAIDPTVRCGHIGRIGAAGPVPSHPEQELVKKLKLILAAAIVAAPMAVMAMPNVGDVVGTKPDDATAALEKAGCNVSAHGAEGGKVEAKCTVARPDLRVPARRPIPSQAACRHPRVPAARATSPHFQGTIARSVPTPDQA